MPKRVVILIPTNKPTISLVALCRDLQDFNIVCVDDGSGSDYNDIFGETEKYATVLRYEKSIGQGGALKYGIRYISENFDTSSCMYVVKAESNGMHSSEEIRRVAEKISVSGGFVLGVHKQTWEASAVSVLKERMMNFVFRIASGRNFTDIHSGLWAFHMNYANLWINLPGNREDYEMNILFSAIEAAEAGKLEIFEVEIESISYSAKQKTDRPVRDLFLICKTIFLASRSLKYLFSSVVAFLIDYFLLLILNSLIPSEASMEIAALVAWMVSSVTNFFLNRNFVFKSSVSLAVAFTEYYGLAAVVFVLKTYVLLEIMTRILHIPLWLSKGTAEVVFFVSNYFIQKKFIFKKKKSDVN